MTLTRRALLQLAALLGAAKMQKKMQTRPIPSTREPLPVIGMGTWRTFDADPSQELTAVLRALFDAGGSLIDSSPMYGRAEQTVGDVLARIPDAKPFRATKVWTSGRENGIAEMKASIRKMGGCDLMQVHNLLDYDVHVKTLREWKANGTIRYWGVTHYQLGAFGELERIVTNDKPDFVQLPYSVGVREAENRLLPACRDHGVAVLVMRPFEGGSLFRDALKRPLPSWAAEIDCTSWAQVFLKFILGHPAVTCPIPATGSPKHMADDVLAGFGRFPDEAMRARIAKELT